MTSLDKSTGQKGKTAMDPVMAMGGLEKILKRKLGQGTVNDKQDQDLNNIKEHFRCMNQGFKQLRQGRTH